MRISFRHGIVKYQHPDFLSVTGSTVTLLASASPFVATIAHGIKNFLVTEYTNIPDAWSGIVPAVDQWLYIDIDTRTGVRTFGTTSLEPIISLNEPANPAQNQHWFDLTNAVMKVWDTNLWFVKIRLFVCRLEAGNLPQSLSDNLIGFNGTQINDYTDVNAGMIIFDGTTGFPIKDKNGNFITSEDSLLTSSSDLTSIKLESLILEGVAATNIPKYSIVHFVDYGIIRPATEYTTTTTDLFGIIMEDAVQGYKTSIITSGLISNNEWDWSIYPVNTPLYSNTTGTLTTTPLYSNQIPVGTIIDPQTIALGVPHTQLTIYGNAAMTTSTAGIALLSVPAVDVGNPIVVGDNDPRLTNDRAPLSHTHVISDVTNLQTTLDAKLDLTGGTLIGPLNVQTPTSSNHPTTKQYVDNKQVGDLSNVTITNIHVDDILKFNGTKWVNTPVPSSTITLQGDIIASGSTSAPLTAVLPFITTAGTYTKVTVDAKGRVTSGTQITSTDIPNFDWTKITTGKPTTVSGYGITDAYTKTETNALNWSWSHITSTPTTLTGYGITDAYTKTETNALNWNWSHITSTPTTLAGYGIGNAIANASGTPSIYQDAASNRPGGVVGQIFIDTTNDKIQRYNGSSWVDIGGAAITLTGDVSGVGATSINVTLNTVPISKGGTGQTTATNALTALLPSQTGHSGKVLSSNGTTAGWIDLPTQAVSSVNGQTGVVNITNITGNAATATILQTSRTISLTGDTTGSVNFNGASNVSLTSTLATVNSTVGTFGSATSIPVITVNGKGLVTNAVDTPLSISFGSLSGKPTTISGYGITDAQQLDDDLTAIAALAGTSGFLKKTAANTWTLDTSSYISANQSITLSGDATGSGSTAITVTLNTVPISKGGTGQTTATDAFRALAPSVTGNSGKVLTNDGTDISWGTMDGLPTQTGNTGKYLTTNGTIASWATVTTGGTVSSVAVSGGTTGLTTSGGPITGSGTITLSGTLGIANGGTGQTTASAAFDALAPTQTGASGQFLTTDGTTTSWDFPPPGTVTSVAVSGGTTGLTTSGGPINGSGTITLSGTLGIANGGTGATSAANAINALVPTQTGNSGKVLTTDGSIVSWSAASGSGTVTSIDVSGGTTGLTTSGGPINGSGTITLSGTLGIANGGTGATSAANAITALLPTQSGQSGKYLSTDGSTVSWSTVASGGGGTSTSTVVADGDVWGVTQTSSLFVQDIAYGFGTYVMVSSGKLYTSDTGQTWTKVQGLTGSVYLVTFAYNKFIVVGQPNIYYSTDAVTWSSVANPSIYQMSYMSYFAQSNMLIAHFNLSLADSAIYSYDGITWNVINAPLSPTLNNSLSKIAYGDGKYVFIDVTAKTVYYSATGLSGWNVAWTFAATVYDIEYFNGKFYIPDTGTGLWVSTNLLSWSSFTPSPVISGAWRKAYAGDGLLLVVGSNTQSMTSTDGINWTNNQVDNSQFVKYISGTFWSIGNSIRTMVRYPTVGNAPLLINRALPSQTNKSGQILSTDGSRVQWQDITNKYVGYSGTTLNNGYTMSVSTAYSGLAYGNNTFVAISQGATVIYYSTDGFAWTSSNIGTARAWNSIAYHPGHNQFYITANGSNSIARGVTLGTWGQITVLPSSGSNNWKIQCVANVDGSYTLFAYNTDAADVVVYDETSTNWIATTITGTTSTWSSATGNGNGTLMIVPTTISPNAPDGQGSLIALSLDNGSTWTSSAYLNTSVGDTVDIYACTYAFDHFVIVGFSQSNQVYRSYTSTDGINWVDAAGLSVIPTPTSGLLYANDLLIYYSNTTNANKWAYATDINSTYGTMSWTTGAPTLPLTSVSGVAYGNGTFMFVYRNTNQRSIILRSVTPSNSTYVGSSLYPSQVSHAGKLLTTDGSIVSWTTTAMLSSIYSQTTTGGSLILRANNLDTTGTISLNSATIDSTALTTLFATPTSVTGFAAATSLILGSSTAAQTITIGGSSTGTSTYNLATGVTAAANTKTVNIGTGSAASSITAINIGSPTGTTTTITAATLNLTSSNLVLSTPLSISNGGTGLSSFGTGLQVLRTNITADGTEWATVGSVYSVDVSGGTTGLTTSGGPITGTGTITLSGTLGIANGGTGQTTANAALNALVPTQTGNAGKFLTTDGSNTIWSIPAGRISTLTYGATMLLDWTNIDVIRITLTGNVTITNSIASYDGQRCLLEITQDGVGGHNVSFTSETLFGSDIVYTPSILGGKTDLIGLSYHQPSGKFRVIAITRGY